mmetsp:Transcript_37348/g.119811  ORF Transcript_37348/g.119811 Transcript_37348/m.119811 type:complete len:235 (-) Transcript_37348:179-883(-)
MVRPAPPALSVRDEDREQRPRERPRRHAGPDPDIADPRSAARPGLGADGLVLLWARAPRVVRRTEPVGEAPRREPRHVQVQRRPRADRLQPVHRRLRRELHLPLLDGRHQDAPERRLRRRAPRLRHRLRLRHHPDVHDLPADDVVELALLAHPDPPQPPPRATPLARPLLKHILHHLEVYHLHRHLLVNDDDDPEHRRRRPFRRRRRLRKSTLQYTVLVENRQKIFYVVDVVIN